MPGRGAKAETSDDDGVDSDDGEGFDDEVGDLDDADGGNDDVGGEGRGL